MSRFNHLPHHLLTNLAVAAVEDLVWEMEMEEVVEMEAVEEMEVEVKRAFARQNPFGIVEPALFADPTDPFGYFAVIEHHRLHHHAGGRGFEHGKHAGLEWQQ